MAWRNSQDLGGQDARGEARAPARDCGEGDAAEESPRPSDFQQAESLSRRRASAFSAEAQKRERLKVTILPWQKRKTSSGLPAGARLRWRAFECLPAAARSRSMSARSRTTFRVRRRACESLSRSR